jgi:hypothetical protein
MKYQINLVRQIRVDEKRMIVLHNRIFVAATFCICLLTLSVVYLVFQILNMEMKISAEKQTLGRIEMEYSKYKATKMQVDKADIELLDNLQGSRIFWTKKLAAMAYYLPENYWITKFGYDARTYKVSGYGYISGQQEQLITLDDYLNKLRADSTYNDVFNTTNFNSVQRSDEEGRSRISFEYSSMH